MNLIIIGKVTLGSLGASAVGVSGWWFYGWMNRVEGFLSVSDSLIDSDKQFKCQVWSVEKFDCNVIESDDLTLSSKNQITFTKFPTNNTKTESLKTYKFYAIKIDKTDFLKFSTKWTNKESFTPIVVFKKDEATDSLGSIYAGFKTDDGTKKIKYFVGQADKKLASTAEHKCSWTSSDFKTCQIFPFVSDDLQEVAAKAADTISSLAFTPTPKEATSIKAHHYYLIQFTNADSDSKSLTEFKNTDIVYLKKVDDTEKVTFSKLSAVLTHKNKIFILKSES